MQSLSQKVYDQLLQRLLENGLVPGEILNRREIARELGVSVAPVLEAMLQLEMEGFLESIPRKGTQVRPIKADDIMGRLVVREALECQAARMYCGKPVKVHEEKLMKLAKEADQSEVGSRQNWETEIVFHRALVELANCPVLTDEFDRVMKLNLFYAVNRLMPHHKESEMDKHEKLVEDLQIEDPDQAEKIIRRHLRVGKGNIYHNDITY